MAVRPSHRLVGVDGTSGDAAVVAKALCTGSSDKVTLCFEGEWLSGGASLVIHDLVAGYWDVPANILKGIDLEIEPRVKVGIIGAAGCGKSTMLLCLLRMLEPRSGSITINGVDTRTLGLQTLRKLFGIVPQDAFLFSGSVRDNLDPCEDYTDSHIWKALAAVGLEDVVKQLRLGSAESHGMDESKKAAGPLDFYIQPGSGHLNSNQCQLLCLARMILRQPAVLLFDGCAPVIDPPTEQLVQRAIRQEFSRSTLVVATRRLEIVLDFDKVALMHHGKIANTTDPSCFRDADELMQWAKASTIDVWDDCCEKSWTKASI